MVRMQKELKGPDKSRRDTELNICQKISFCVFDHYKKTSQEGACSVRRVI
jgi:hypothetical protein